MIQGEIMKTRNLAVIIYKEDDLYIAECPEVGTVDQGETIEAAIPSGRLRQRGFENCDTVVFGVVSNV